MYELSVEVTYEEFQTLENLLFESELLSGWNLYENFEDKGYWLKGIFESEDAAGESWENICHECDFSGEPQLRELEDKDWKESYKEHFKPWSIDNLHWVPLWLKEEYEVPVGDQAVFLDPGMAFGTGNHATTRLCVEQLVAFKEQRKNIEKAKIIDAGCGSGILAISAAKLRANDIHAFDNDAEAVRIAKENAVLNSVPESYFTEGDLVTGFQGRQVDCLMANILANVLVQYSRNLVDAVAPNGWLILSGILGTEVDEVLNAFMPLASWTGAEKTFLDEWACIRLVRG